MKLTTYCGISILPILLVACSGLFPAPISTPTPTLPTGTPTVTIAWFPPTNTPSPFPTQTILPTPEQLPGVGGSLFTDNFDTPELWSTSAASGVSAGVTRNRLILSISGQGPLPITSLRTQPILGDFYAEANVSLSLCGDQDQFGVVFRASPGDNYYRYVVSCDGRTRLERSLSGSRAPLLDWLTSSDAPSAAPAEVKLGLWAVGSEMRFFLNDQYQFTSSDPVLHAGTLGFFAYANGAQPITVSFSNLAVFSVTYTFPTPSPIPSITLIPSQTPTH